MTDSKVSNTNERWDDYHRRVFSEAPYPGDPRPTRNLHLTNRLAQVGLTPTNFLGKRVLDAGCGTGLNAEILRSWGAVVVGCDIAEGGLRAARDRGISIIQANLAQLPVKEGKFDVVLALGVLHHVDRPRACLSQLVAALRPGGEVIVSWIHPTGGFRYFLAVNLLLNWLCGTDLSRRLRWARVLGRPWEPWARRRGRDLDLWRHDWYGASYHWLTPPRLLQLPSGIHVTALWPPWGPWAALKSFLAGADSCVARISRGHDLRSSVSTASGESSSP